MIAAARGRNIVRAGPARERQNERMATLRRELSIDAPADDVWRAFRDVGAVHRRLARGFVTDCQLDGDTRAITFANGMVARERIVTVDEPARRLAYAASAEGLTHHNASFEVLAEGPRRTRVIWLADLLPDGMEGAIGAMMDEGSRAMKRTLEAGDAEREVSAPRGT